MTIDEDTLKVQILTQLDGSEALLDSLYDSGIPLIQTINDINGSIL